MAQLSPTARTRRIFSFRDKLKDRRSTVDPIDALAREKYWQAERILSDRLDDEEIDYEEWLLLIEEQIATYMQMTHGMSKVHADRIIKACKSLKIPAQVMPVGMQHEDSYAITLFNVREMTYRNYNAIRLVLMAKELELGKNL